MSIKEHLGINKQIPVNCMMSDCSHFHTCTQCPTEYYSKTKTVDVLFVGPCSGQVEETLHRPLVGPAGKRLRQILSYFWNKHKYFPIALSNSVRCYPKTDDGKDRVPTQYEMDYCNQFLFRDIAKLNPKIIVPLGLAATSMFIKTEDVTMAKLHGRPHKIKVLFGDYTVVPTYHPSYVLQNAGHNFNYKQPSNYDMMIISDLEKVIKLMENEQ